MENSANPIDPYLQLDGSSGSKVSVRIDNSQTKEFLQNVIPFSDAKEIPGELRKRFPLEQPKKRKPQKRRYHTKKSKLSYKEMKDLNLRKLPKKGNKYQDFLLLNNLWCGYIKSYVNLDDIRNGGGVSEQGTLMLQKADFHGAIIKVVRSRCPSLVGHKGIILMDTKNTFLIICQDNSIKTVPKHNSLFEIYVEDITMTIFGKHFIMKSAERSTKKIKTRLIKDL